MGINNFVPIDKMSGASSFSPCFMLYALFCFFVFFKKQPFLIDGKQFSSHLFYLVVRLRFSMFVYLSFVFVFLQTSIYNQFLLLFLFNWVIGFSTFYVLTRSKNVCVKKVSLSIAFQLLFPLVTIFFLRYKYLKIFCSRFYESFFFIASGFCAIFRKSFYTSKS